jgi:hypothetical protein
MKNAVYARALAMLFLAGLLVSASVPGRPPAEGTS